MKYLATAICAVALLFAGNAIANGKGAVGHCNTQFVDAVKDCQAEPGNLGACVSGATEQRELCRACTDTFQNNVRACTTLDPAGIPSCLQSAWQTRLNCSSVDSCQEACDDALDGTITACQTQWDVSICTSQSCIDIVTENLNACVADAQQQAVFCSFGCDPANCFNSCNSYHTSAIATCEANYDISNCGGAPSCIEIVTAQLNACIAEADSDQSLCLASCPQ